ncbi:hypothetical protein F6455_18265 [Proteobacteria bacterium 005FR1]|nr:hypothetical protein [Proteobacteria bacterium 005FR1]
MRKTKRLAAKIGTCGLVLGLAACSTIGTGQGNERPELTGIWTNASLTNLSRPRGVDKLVLSPQEAQMLAAKTGVAGISPEEASDNAVTDPDAPPPPKGSSDFGLRGYNSFWIDPGSSLARVRGEFRSSYIIEPSNGQVPRLKEPKVKLKDHGFGRRYVTGIGDASGPEALPLAERCLLGFGNTAGPGMMGTLYNSTYQFVQTDDHVMILVEMAHDARIIPTFASKKEAQANHRPAVMKPWFGDSVGWYEGNTLVVETTNIKPLQMEQSSIPITQDGKFIERFTRHSDTEIVYQFTVEDSNLYSRPWTAELSFHATEGPVYEYACHEGNYAMEGILAGARKKEREAAGNN